MSLISEALRKARQHAAERGDAERGVVYPQVPILRPRGGRLGTGLVLGATIALAAALAGAAVVWWAVGSLEESPAVAERPAVDPSDFDPRTAVADSPSVAQENDGTPAVATGQNPEEPASTGSQPEGLEPTTRLGQPVDPPADEGITPTVRPPQENAEDFSTDSPLSEPDDPTTPPPRQGAYFIEADLGHVTLTLDFIVFRPDDPFAEINGLEVHVGSTIEGFRVEKIEKSQVTLRDEEGELVLRAP